MRAIHPINNNGSIQIKFTYQGKRYSFNPLPRASFGDKAKLAKAKQIAAQIESDILSGEFDASLQRYKVKRKAHKSPKFFIEVWDAWTEALNLPAHTKAADYDTVRRMIAKASPKPSQADWFIDYRTPKGNLLAPSTFNKRLSLLKSCAKWGVEQAWLNSSPYSSIKSRKTVKSEIKPFSTDEIALIISGFESRFPHYANFVRFLFFTGVRTSEAIGLRWGSIDFERDEIVIKESLSRDRTGNGYKRIRKSTKTGRIRYLSINSQLRALLLEIKPVGKGHEDGLVFTSSKGCCISSDNFRADWRLVLQDVGVPYRKPYSSRHTLISHAIAQGVPLTGIAYIAGHVDTQMVMRTYGHMIDRPNLPEIEI